MAKKNLNVTLHMSELIYDVQNKTFLTGRSRSDGSNMEYVSHMQANSDEENENQIIRSIGNAFSTLKNRLSEYVVASSSSSSVSNALISASSNLVLSLAMPSNYNQATAETIAAAVHQYLVNIALSDWFTITSKTDAADYAALSQVNLNEIRDAINKRVRPERSMVM